MATPAAEVRTKFFTLTYSFESDVVAVDQVHPLVFELYDSLNKQNNIRGRNEMDVAEELTVDLVSSYNLFMAALPLLEHACWFEVRI